MNFYNDRVFSTRTRCKHLGVVSISIRYHKRDDGADERPAGATAKSLA